MLMIRISCLLFYFGVTAHCARKANAFSCSKLVVVVAPNIRTHNSSKKSFLTTQLRLSNSQDDKQRKDRDDDDDDNDDDEQEEEEDYIDENSLGDWRSFRATLVSSSPSSSPFDGSDYGLLALEQDDGNIDALEKSSNKVTSPQDKGMTQPSSKPQRPKSVSKDNELLLKSQSNSLAEEYKSVWCHELSVPEVGGLVIRLPLEVEIYKNKDQLLGIGQELNLLLDNDDDDDDDDEMDEMDESSNEEDKNHLNTSSAVTTRQDAQANMEQISDNDQDSSISILSAQTLFWYRKVQRMIKDKMAYIASFADGNGTIDPRKLKPDDEILLNLYIDNQSTWQEVCLVIDKDDEKGTVKTVVLNRPMAFNLSSENLAKLVLFGSIYSNPRGGMMIARESTPVSQTNRYMKFLRAFEASCGVYIGGPNKMSEPAILIHGFRDLEGSTEISPGTGIYQGGIDAAIDGVLSGKYKPLDFRFFVGRHEYKSGELDVSISSKKHQAVACARALALKQCIQLPKPLWHEVLELCGGEWNEISKIEYQKRKDLLF